ncbi:prolyl aminopeptidase [Ochrobactrum sp. MYb15]|uniref:prolyl aminopeptidase n=1 Tax=Brucella TaxID=234 RepID=UPI000465B89A|nr:prolyl aminopeptidase [Brucella rhizosphaerae]PQZ50203.1 prolyl aminopeptidase [Ochrobactrum sp. MYb19]PRA68245.1 prolyl aminopeptidase [Ochrobactrum sp. MYb18]PRA74528.1 prolyl aminopeptidase [Brucella thiophenivorans]PRA90495.1 prolyl aminopeptidase [Ochrobactrum sp. MYb14]PRA95946.1 prolyl aminopeptidase [Ochrobactrum sp. MYb15]
MPYPQHQPFANGLLAVSTGNEIYWEASGNPKGKPALYLHGGPGSGLRSGSYRQRFDPEKYHIIGIDQRGCGRSRPLAIGDLDQLHLNNTHTLIEDIEAVRKHLGINQWLIAGSSWGATLALAYAQAHPDHVSEMVLVAVTTTSRSEVNWITEGVGNLFPEAWDEFEKASLRRDGERVVEAYARRLASDCLEDRLQAAHDWNRWETTHISLDPNWTPIESRFDKIAGLAFATLVTHYWANDGFLRDGREILNGMEKIAHIPAVLICGRRDFSGPAITAWRLHKAWPASQLRIIETEGHGGPPSMEEMQAALDTFAHDENSPD